MGSQKGGQLEWFLKKGDEFNRLDAKSKKQTNKGEKGQVEWLGCQHIYSIPLSQQTGLYQNSQTDWSKSK